jgi:hypothetical protein
MTRNTRARLANVATPLLLETIERQLVQDFQRLRIGLV